MIEQLKENKVQTLNLGFCPFSNIDSKDKISYLFKLIYKNKFLFSPSGLHYFKQKFGSQDEPEFYFFENNSSEFFSLFNIFKTNL
jgi:lysylphosphatidylglycerol synthetase-like protein (DUF2156 family)